MPESEKTHHINIKIDMLVSKTSDIDYISHELETLIKDNRAPGTSSSMAIDSTIILP